MKPIVIIGSGISAYTVAREFRKINQKTPIHLISKDSANNYSKPMLSNAFAKSKTPDSLVMTEMSKMAEQLNIKISDNTLVHSINTENKTVGLASENIAYSKLVLALGAKPIRIPLKGDAVDQILTVNNLDDYSKFRKTIKAKKNIVILGPGLIGCEFANDLLPQKFNVTIIGPDKYPLQNMLPEAAGKHLQKELSEIGVNWCLNTVVEQVDASDQQLQLQLSNGDVITADVILSAIGLKPESFLAQECALNVNRGIVVDKTLRTSCEDIYALGDCAEIAGLVMPYIMPIMHSARALAQTLAAGEDAAVEVSFPAMPIVIKTPACPIVVASPVDVNEGEWRVEEKSDGVRACYYQNDNLTGFALTGACISEKQELLKQLPGYF